jgi:hypothetical protein
MTIRINKEAFAAISARIAKDERALRPKVPEDVAPIAERLRKGPRDVGLMREAADALEALALQNKKLENRLANARMDTWRSNEERQRLMKEDDGSELHESKTPGQVLAEAQGHIWELLDSAEQSVQEIAASHFLAAMGQQAHAPRDVSNACPFTRSSRRTPCAKTGIRSTAYLSTSVIQYDSLRIGSPRRH